MIEILIVDDDERKTNRIRTAVRETFHQVAVTAVVNVYEASQALRKQPFDLMILDLNIPMREGELPCAEGGLRLLRSMKNKQGLNVPTHIIGLTAYDSLYKEHIAQFQNESWLLLPYEENSSAWETSLEHKLAHIAETKQSARDKNTSPQRGVFPYVIAFVVIAGVLIAVGRWVPWYALIPVILAILMGMALIGILQMRNDERLADAGFIDLVKAYLASLRLFGQLHNADKEKPKSTVSRNAP
jgi:CheY-like chemotaxis protein